MPLKLCSTINISLKMCFTQKNDLYVEKKIFSTHSVHMKLYFTVQEWREIFFLYHQFVPQLIREVCTIFFSIQKYKINKSFTIFYSFYFLTQKQKKSFNWLHAKYKKWFMLSRCKHFEREKIALCVLLYRLNTEIWYE